MKYPHLFWIALGLLGMAPGGVRAAENPATLELGAPAPSFQLRGVDDKIYRLESFAEAEILVIIFTCNHCPTAQAYEQRIIDVTSDYKPRGVAVVAISPNDPKAIVLNELGYTDLSDTFAEMKIRARDRGFNFPYLYDGDTQEVSLQYGPTATPHAFVFDADRRLRYVGRLDKQEKPGTGHAEDLRRALDELLAGQPVSVPKTKTFGCSIKWSWKNQYRLETLEKWANLPVELEPIDIAGLKKLVQNDSAKLRLINVWATWCGPCLAEFPDLVETDRMYRHRDFEMVTVSADELQKRDRALKFLQSQEASNLNYIYSGGDKYALIEAISPEWNGALPFTMVVAPGGHVVYSQQGAIDALELRRAIVENPLLGRYY